MHFGMTGLSSGTALIMDKAYSEAGWIHIRGDQTAYTNYYKKMKDAELQQWPPRFWKFQLTTEGDPSVQIAFTDARRFGRVRLVDCPADEIRKRPPLSLNGPDPVVDEDLFNLEYLQSKTTARHVPIKALLLDQTMISGIGNWVADETLYQAKMHPEQYCDEFSNTEIETLYKSIRYVCQTAVDKLGDSDAFPKDWLFDYRWGKGNKGAATTLPNGEKLAFINVGGRTSCYVPAVQKKTGKVNPSVRRESTKKPEKSIAKEEETEEEEEEEEEEKPTLKKGRKRKPTKGKDMSVAAIDPGGTTEKPNKRIKSSKTAKTESCKSKEILKEIPERRRSARIRG